MTVLKAAYDKLLERFGPQGWWPGETPLEIVVGAILTQNTNWQNAARAIEQLREAAVLQLPELHTISIAELEQLLRPAGYYRIKARRLRNLTQRIVDEFDGDLDRLLELSGDALREQLLTVRGVGPETADSIVLYAANQPIFVVDAYTARVVKRHGWLEPEADYHAMQTYFHDALPAETQLFNEYHALIVRVGKEYCRPTPRCEGCPLESLLPDGGPCGDPDEAVKRMGSRGLGR